MSRADSARPRPDPDTGREAHINRPERRPKDDSGAGPDPGDIRHDWADEAAKARTTDDPRRLAPHDRAGVPSTGDSR